jgi:hypothetical protein
MKSRFHGAHRPAGASGDGLEWQARPIGEDDHDSEIRLQKPDLPEELVALKHIVKRIASIGRRLVEGDEPDARSPPKVIAARVDENSVEPGVEALRITKAGGPPPRPDHGVLRRIPCVVGVAKDETSEAIGAVEPMVDECEDLLNGRSLTG